MSKQDYYATLGLDKGADEAAIKSAYRKLAMKYHPDKNPGDQTAEQKFKDINEAYDVLKDPQKKAAYDRFGHQAFDGRGFGQGGHPGFDFGDSFSDVFEDLFGEFMGGARRRGGGGSPARRGADIRFNLNISLEDAFHGKEQKVKVNATDSCGDCNGSGARAGSRPQTCPQCKGAGQVRMQQGFFMIQKTCGNCQGAGQVISDPCRTCSGSGRVQKEKTLSVKIPAGVEDGNRIRLSGEGEAGIRGGPPGDLYIFVSVRPHELFRRHGENLFCRVPIPMTEAVLGGEIVVPTISGKKAKVKIPAGTQSGNQFRLGGKGMPILNSTRSGDMIIEALVETPVNLSREQKELMKKFAEEDGKKWSPESSKFFSRIREMWDDLTD